MADPRQELLAEIKRFGETWRDLMEEFQLTPEQMQRCVRLCGIHTAQGKFFKDKDEIRMYLLFWMTDHSEMTVH